MCFNRYLLIYIIGATLSVAYNPSVASPPFDGYNNAYSPEAIKVEKQKRNPWAVKKPVERGFIQQYRPRMPDGQGSKFITEEELDALNNQSVIYNGPGISPGWQPLPEMKGLRQRPGYYNTPSYRQSPGNRYESGREVELRTEKNQWNQTPAGLPVLPVDPMDPGRYGTPFSGPFEGIDSLMYE